MRAIADHRDRAKQSGERRAPRVPAQARPMRREIDVRLRDAGLARQIIFDEPDARPAMDAVEEQRRFPQVAVEMGDETGRFCTVGAERERLVAFALDALGVHRFALPVEPIEARRPDRLRDSQASRAAKSALVAVDDRAPGRRSWVGLAAVKAAARLAGDRLNAHGGVSRCRWSELPAPARWAAVRG